MSIVQIIKRIIITLFFYGIISCAIEPDIAENTNVNTRKSQTIPENRNPKFCSLAYTADVVIISDVFFALQFISSVRVPELSAAQKNTSNLLSYDAFYTLSNKLSLDASLYLVHTNPYPVNQTVPNPNNNDFFSTYINNFYNQLSNYQYKRALHAKNLVITPLASVYAKQDINDIKRYRKSCNLSPPKIPLRAEYGKLENLIELNYTSALNELSKEIGRQLQKEIDAQRKAELVIIANTDTQEVVNDINTILLSVRTQVPQSNIRIVWKEIDAQLRNSSNIQNEVMTANSIVLVHAGAETARLTKLINTQGGIIRERIFAILNWQPSAYSLPSHFVTDINERVYSIYAQAWVAMPLEQLFSTKPYANAKLYRHKIIE